MHSFSALSLAIPQSTDPQVTSEMAPQMEIPFNDSHTGLFVANQSYQKVLSYKLFLAHPAEKHNDEAWTNSAGHSVNLLQVDPEDRSQDRLFVNDVEIEPENWRWCIDGVTLRWNQGSGDHHLAGELAFDKYRNRAVGSVMIGGEQHSAVAQSRPASYSCKLVSESTAAYKAEGKLKWNKNDAWNNASLWSSDALLWNFWVEEYVDDYGERGYRPRIRFEDRQTGYVWEPLVGTYTAYMTYTDEKFIYYFKLDRMQGNPPKDERSSLSGETDRRIASVFPVELVMQLDPSAMQVEGVMEVVTEGEKTEIYGVQGMPANPELLALFACPRPESSDKQATTLTALTAEAQELSPYYLINLDPYEFIEIGGGKDQKNGKDAPKSKVVRDAVQHTAEASLLQIIQYYMPRNLRENFISNAPIELEAPIRAIAETAVPNPGKPGEMVDPKGFYQSLAAPLLTIVLRSKSKKLNARRARKLFEERLSASPVYQKHAPMLYRAHFLDKFPAVRQYLADEQMNADDKRKKIEKYTDTKRAEYTKLRDQAETDEVRQQYDLLLKELDEAKEKALNGKYWAHRVFTHFTGDDFLNMLKMQLFASPDGANAAVRNIQRVSTILSVLDESQYFATKFAECMRIFQLYNVIAQYASMREDQATLREVTSEIAQKFAKQHDGSTDQLMKLVAEAIQKAEEDRAKQQGNLWTEVMEILYIWFEQVGRAQSLAQLLAKVTAKLNPLLDKIEQAIIKNPHIRQQVEKVGLVTKTVASKMLWFGLGLLTFGCMVTMMALNWNNLDDVSRVGLVMVGAGMVANFALSIFKAGQDFYTVYRGTGSLRGALKWAVGLENFSVARMELTFATVASDHLAKLSGGRIQLARWAQLPGWRGKAAQFAVRFIVNLTRVIAIAVSAVMAAVNIVLAAISLAHSKTPLEKAANALAITASILELIGLGFELASVLAVGTAASVLGVIAGVFAGLAILVALAGLGIIIYLAIVSRTSLVDEFVQNEAAKDRLDMPNDTAIDYLLPLYDETGRLIKEGVCIGALAFDGTVSTYLRIENDGTIGAGELTGDQTTCFGISTDGQGRALIFAASVPAGKNVVLRYLTVSEEGKLVTEESRLEGDKRYRQLWNTEIVGKTEVQKPGKQEEGEIEEQLTKGQFRLFIQDQSGNRSYLSNEGGTFRLSSNPQDLVLSLESTKPTNLHMDDVNLSTGDRDTSFYANLAFPGCEPRSWSISGLIPDFLSFDPNAGALKQKEGISPQVGTFGPFMITVTSGAFEGLTSNPFKVIVQQESLEGAVIV